MNMARALLIGTGLLSVGALVPLTQSAEGAAAEKRKMVHITRLYTGPDGLTHAEEIEALGPSGTDVYKFLANSGAELRRSPPGRFSDWHNAPRRQYVITLSGHAELELSNGKKISVGPGDIELAEDLTGKGHTTRTVGTEERVTIAIPLTSQ